jgi:hypothetical protein
MPWSEIVQILLLVEKKAEDPQIKADIAKLWADIQAEMKNKNLTNAVTVLMDVLKLSKDAGL